MPVVGSSAYNTAGQITSLVRSLLNDAQGNLFTDTVLLPYANSAYRKAQRALGNAGGGGFIQDDVLLVVPAVTQVDTSLQVSVTDATAPPNQLPTDLLVPVKLWERANGSSDDFVEMADLSQHGGLPSREQGLTLSVWEWRADGIYFLGATQDTQIRLRYVKAYPDFTDATSPVLVRNAQEALAHATAALAGWARGSPLAEKWDEAASDALEDLVAAAVRRRAAVRPPPPALFRPQRLHPVLESFVVCIRSRGCNSRPKNFWSAVACYRFFGGNMGQNVSRSQSSFRVADSASKRRPACSTPASPPHSKKIGRKNAHHDHAFAQ